MTELLLALLFSVPPQSTEGWKGIVPLITKRSEAENIVRVRTNCENYCIYKCGGDRIFIRYADEPCSKENKWIVPRGTVTEISVYGDTPKLSELKLNSRKFKKTPDPELNGYYSYENEQDGVTYSVSQEGRVTGTHWIATAERHRKLRCPSAPTPEIGNKSSGGKQAARSLTLVMRVTVGNNRTWQPATYRGLVMGKAKVADMRRIFGTPTRVERFDQGKSYPEVWYHYDGVWEFPGTLRFIVDKTPIREVRLLPTHLTKEEAIKRFGPDYMVTRYDFDLCLGDEEAAPLFESPAGNVINIEYRHRGIALAVNAYGDIDTIHYVSEPVGAESSKCNKNSKAFDAVL